MDTPNARERLQLWIDRSKITQLETARLIDMDPTQLSQILSGKRRPGLDNAVKIQRITGIDPSAWVPSTPDGESEAVAAGSKIARFGKA